MVKEKLLSVQTKLKAPKGNYNSFGGYSYRSAEDILEAAKPLLAEQGLLLTLSDELVLIGDRFYVKASAAISDGDDQLFVSAYAREPQDKKGMDGSQITGTASSYARKYALNGLFLIDDTKDADTDEYHKQTKGLSAKKQKEIRTMLETLGIAERYIYKEYGVRSLADLSEDQYSNCVARLNKKADAELK